MRAPAAVGAGLAVGCFGPAALLAQAPADWQGTITAIQTTSVTSSESEPGRNAHLVPDHTFQVVTSRSHDLSQRTTLTVTVQVLPRSSDSEPQTGSISASYTSEMVSKETQETKTRCTRNGPVVTANVVTTGRVTGSGSTTVQGTVSVSESGFGFASPEMQVTTTSSTGVTGAGVCGRSHEPTNASGTQAVDLEQFGVSDLQPEPARPNVLSGSRTETVGPMTTTYTWNLHRGRCAKPSAPKLGKTLAVEQKGLVQGMRDAGLEVGPEHVTMKQAGIPEFSVRIAGGGCMLPSAETIEASCPAPGSQEGAKRMLIGAVQHEGGRTRVTARVVNVESGEVLKAAKADATGPDATATAMAHALEQLDLQLECVKGVN